MNDMQQQPTHTPSAQERVTKGLAVVGFLGLLVALAWLIFTGIGFLPTLINNMASVTQTGTDYELSTYPLENSISHNSTVGVEWSDVNTPGEFEFSYACNDGVSAEIRTTAQGIQTLACDTSYSVGNVTGVDLTLRSVSNRFTDVLYTVTFLPENNPEGSISANGRIAVFNPDVSILGTDDEAADDLATTTPPAANEDEEGDVEESEPVTESSVSSPASPAPSPTYVTQYEIPESDPNGNTNLHVSYLGVGELNNDNDFTPRGSLSNDRTGAIRFTVKNTGTRTSETWTYSATLPNGQKYTSDTQLGLKPNETATLTLGFQTGSTDGDFPFTIEVDTVRDIDRSNNDLRWSVRIR